MCLNAGGMGRIDAETETLIATTGGVFDVAHTLKAEGFDAGEDGTGRATPTLRSMAHDGSHQNGGGQLGVMTLAIRGRGDSHNLEYREDGTANAVLTPNGGRGGIGVGAIATTMAVRRLTPLECTRLQGFPDDYFNIPGKPFHDGPIYKMLGNSMAVNVMRWIGERIQSVKEIAA
jgi:DNA (cytosine-5)-methyltransferase 1